MLTGTYVCVQKYINKTYAWVQKYLIHVCTHTHGYMHTHIQTVYVWALATLVEECPQTGTPEGLLQAVGIHAPLPQPSSPLSSPYSIGCC